MIQTVSIPGNFAANQHLSASHRFAMRAVAAALCLTLTACATQGQTGALVGAVLGAAVGKAVGGRDGALAGAAIGALIGGGIGANMDAADKRRLALARASAAESASRQTFYAASAKATVVIEPSPVAYQPKGAKIALAPDLVDRPLIEQTPVTTTAYVNTPIYAAPTFDASPKMVIPAGEPVTTVAQIRGEDDWVVVGTAGYGLGYAHKKMLQPEVSADVANATRAPEIEKPSETPIVAATNDKPTAKVGDGKKPAVAAKPQPKVPNKVTAPIAPVAPAAPVAAATPTTDSLLSPSASYLPPKSHLQAAPADAASYTKSLERGKDQGKAAIASGRSAGEVRVVSTAVECRDLTSILLSNNKELSREKTTACKKSDGSWTI